MAQTKTEKKALTCKLSLDEIRQRGEELADLNQHEMRLKNELKTFNSLKKSELDTNRERIAQVSDMIRTGETEKFVTVKIEYDAPKADWKQMTREDTGEQWSEPMNQDDYDLFMGVSNPLGIEGLNVTVSRGGEHEEF